METYSQTFVEVLLSDDEDPFADEICLLGGNALEWTHDEWDRWLQDTLSDSGHMDAMESGEMCSAYIADPMECEYPEGTVLEWQWELVSSYTKA